MKEVIENSDAVSKGNWPEKPENSKGPVYFTDLFNSEFMKLYTQYNTIEELLLAGGFEVNSEEDYEAIPDEIIDSHVAKTTNFQSWKEMLTEAVKDYISQDSLH